MGNRLTLHNILVDLLGSPNAYFQPPESVKMKYPCFRYSVENIPASHADDIPYKTNNRYLVIYMTRDPDSDMPDKVVRVKGFAYERYYAADNIHHHVFTYTFY